MEVIFVKEHNMHIKPKFYKVKLLEKLVVQYGIRIWFDRKSYVWVASP